jgi:DCN1-like protein 1/2
MNGTMRYLETLGLDPEDPAVLVLAYCLRSPSLGIFSRQGFVEGWRSLGYVHRNSY